MLVAVLPTSSAKRLRLITIRGKRGIFVACGIVEQGVYDCEKKDGD